MALKKVKFEKDEEAKIKQQEEKYACRPPTERDLYRENAVYFKLGANSTASAKATTSKSSSASSSC